jgi:lambda repressor-like predicted transcriptional regulator
MANERLRAALLERGITLASLALEIDVDEKTIERWITKGRTPYRRHRLAVAKHLGLDEGYLWPDALPVAQVTEASESEIVTVYPRRLAVSREAWVHLFDSAEREIGMLVYAGLFLAEDAEILAIIAAKARAGAQVRILIGDPESPEVAQRGTDERIDEAVAARIRSCLALFRPLRRVDGIEFRYHRTILYNSIFYADDEYLINTHVYGEPGARAPVLRLRKVAGGKVANMYRESFERVWESGTPITTED